MFQIQRPEIKPMVTAHLAQTMTLLEKSNLELVNTIEEALANNPALDLEQPKLCQVCKTPLITTDYCPICTRSSAENEPIVFTTLRDTTPQYPVTEGGDEFIAEEIYYKTHEDLPSYVLKQVANELDREDLLIAAHILSNINEDGILTGVKPLDIALYFHVPRSKIEFVRQKIMKSDPVGVGALSTKEALLIQLETLNVDEELKNLVNKLLNDHFDLLGRQRTKELAKILGVSQDTARKMLIFIKNNLNPFPARTAWGDVRSGQEAPTDNFGPPDIIISTLTPDESSPLVVEVLIPLRGIPKVNSRIKTLVADNHDEKWVDMVDNASLLVKCLQQRNRALEKLMHFLSIEQRGFIMKGPKYHKPLTRATVAKKLKVHESTISRAVSNKSVQLPNGKIILLDVFFDRSLAIRHKIKEMIRQENYPLSDAQIAKILSEDGIHIARRTVAKYRSIEGILPAHLRKIEKFNNL